VTASLHIEASSLSTMPASPHGQEAEGWRRRHETSPPSGKRGRALAYFVEELRGREEQGASKASRSAARRRPTEGGEDKTSTPGGFSRQFLLQEGPPGPGWCGRGHAGAAISGMGSAIGSGADGDWERRGQPIQRLSQLVYNFGST
jgi:hypothetical protein